MKDVKNWGIIKLTTQQNLNQKQQKKNGFAKKAIPKKAIPKKHEQRLMFERLLTELSVAFVKIPVEDVDNKVEEVLQSIGDMLGFDRVNFVQYLKGTKQLKITHSWSATGGARYPSIIPNKYYPWFIEKTKTGKSLYFNTKDLPNEAERDQHTLFDMGIKSGLLIPYMEKKIYYGTIFFESHTRYKRAWIDAYSQRLKLLAEVIINALIRKQVETELREAFSEIQSLKDQLQRENIYLNKEIEIIKQQSEIIGESDEIKKILKQIQHVANTNSTVLILGETGTGKELVARAVHKMSLRKNRAMVTVNCAALPAALIEGELFGREKGAYTGAVSKQTGRFEIADGSTIFLDEIGELPMELQVKLLRVLQYGEFERLGSNKTIKADVRVIAATNRNLEQAIKKGNFREDLYYRLNVYPIKVPALRERVQDILPLTWNFIKELSIAMGKRVDIISRSNLESLRNYSWPGNVRELRNVVERSMIGCDGRSLILDIPQIDMNNVSCNLTLDEHQKQYILKTLKKTGWKIRGKDGTAQLLGIKPTTLYSRMQKLGIKRPV